MIHALYLENPTDEEITKSLEHDLYMFELLEWGVLHEAHGLTYKMPLCHDSSEGY